MTMTDNLPHANFGSAPSNFASATRTPADITVVTGPLDTEQATQLRAHAEAGGSVLVAIEPGDEVARDLCGVTVTADLPRTEWFVTLGARPEAVRLAGEVPVTSMLRTLRPVADEVTVVATTSVRFDHQPTVAVRTVGAGRIVSTGVSDVDALQSHTTLGPFISRLLRPTFVPSTTTLGLAVVGYGPFGGMGYLHGLAATETEGFAFVAAADTSADRIDAARADFPDLVGHDSVTSLAANPDVDVAVIATPPSFHATLALELLRAGKHVVME
jgi:hypothetical protein